MRITRREFLSSTAAGAASLALPQFAAGEEGESFDYIVASCMYGKAPLSDIVPEVPKCGAKFIELWAEPHGNQREQVDELGERAVRQLFDEHDVRLGSITCFKFGIFDMQPEMRLARRLGGDMVICNSGGPKNLEGDELANAVRQFAEKLKPHVEVAEELGITIGVENHGGGLISSPESITRLLDQIDSPRLGLAMAPYHLPQDPQLISGMIDRLGNRLVHIQAWEHGNGAMKKLPKEEELLQLPHRGPLNWCPIVDALRRNKFSGRVEIFMHPVPRGVPILPTLDAVTAEINKGRRYLESCVT